MKIEDFTKLYLQEFNIPLIENSQKMWFFRTQGGQFYYDFCTNNYIAIGWDKISKEDILRDNADRDVLKELIVSKYPDENRPGLVLNQLINFYSGMKDEDWVVIPSEGTKTISIGILKGFEGEFDHKIVYDEDNEQSEYAECKYSHKRHVIWYKEVNIEHDLYLLRSLRGQQTISDITDTSEFIFRNLFPCYIKDQSAHFTLQKISEGNFGFNDSIKIQKAIQQIIDNTSRLYSDDDLSDGMVLKTAVGSPGFLELIIPLLKMSGYPAIALFFIILSKSKDKDGNSYSGISGILSAVNNIIDSILSKEQKKADVLKTQAETEKIKAEANLTNAQAHKTEAEAKLLDIQYANEVDRKKQFVQELDDEAENRKLLKFYNNVPQKEKENRIREISKSTGELEEAAKASGIVFSDSER